MGKKSVVDTPLLPSHEDQGLDALGVRLPPQQTALRELFQEFLRVALQAQVDTQERSSKIQVSTSLLYWTSTGNSVGRSVIRFFML